MSRSFFAPSRATLREAVVPAPAASASDGDMPDAEACWVALRRRDRAFNGRFYFAVRTTGVYCLPSCGARTPRRENVAFHPSCEAAEAAGFRPCKRCRPREWLTGKGLSRAVATACRLLDDIDADTPPSLEAIARKVGITASTLTRRFQRELGVSPRDWLAARKTGRFKAALKSGESVTEALYGAGYGSSSRVYENADKVLGMTPATYRKGGAGARIAYAIADSDHGRVLVGATHKGIAAVYLGDNDTKLADDLHRDFPAAEIVRDNDALEPRVKAVLARLDGRKPSAIDAVDLPLDIVGTAFQWRVWKALTDIPVGETLTYGAIAERLGEPGAARAVGRACATNPVAIVVPCHRAVGASGALTGYRWGVDRKRKILAEEKRRAAR
ncbi:bifunctional DNA-binding transcriptional regulator/O6-methylguanine-DNA methyltransferase Ada [Vineibacter terrae]|uniref:bifunctional DNA-binding transcriptional regulator/O6-methylguanine-DNA methyltransferase Ada n=1 Tax=Vineibacter terrae TaxID=2586908 RepID=UPI002E356CBB|nr:bifunctional DNA-binding transcriptional regulator/O6-methylguanine-DNA methyltransferase Ada [Vineibacter terrae]HEX2891664.1 bifunctional DNA-binding transcriptional regulator/O6-methylguanine-DNA methyltransferase Ada [Vineibacter terrae]